MNKLVDSGILANKFERQAKLPSGNKAYWSESYERRLQALFEAIIAEDIMSRPGPDEVKKAKKT